MSALRIPVRPFRGLWAVPLILAACAWARAETPAAEGADAYRRPGPYEVAATDYDWTDADRDRPVPAKVYSPKTGDGPFPVIVFSHGLGGSREGYAYLGKHWASHGYVSVHLQHKGSDDEVWNGFDAGRRDDLLAAMRQAAANPRNALDRPRDVSFAIDRVTELNRTDAALRGRLDLDRVGAAGHSFGAYTTLAAAGQVFVGPLGGQISLGDKRVKAAIPMSAPVPRRRDQLDRAFGSIAIPCLHMTGTLDDSPIGDTKASERRLPFDHIQKADQYLITFLGGDHMIFSGRPRRWGGGEHDAEFQSLIALTSTAFWDAYLKMKPQAKEWLSGGGMQAVLGDLGKMESRLM